MRLPVRPETAAAQGPARINVRFPTMADIQICAQLEVFAVLQGRSGSVDLTHSWKWKNALQRVIAGLGAPERVAGNSTSASSAKWSSTPS
jgi:hypothetical protein